MLKIVLINPIAEKPIGDITFNSVTAAERYAESQGQPYVISTLWVERG